MAIQTQKSEGGQSPSDFIFGGYLVAMDRVLNPLIPFLSHPAFIKSFLSDALQPDFSFG